MGNTTDLQRQAKDIADCFSDFDMRYVQQMREQGDEDYRATLVDLLRRIERGELVEVKKGGSE